MLIASGHGLAELGALRVEVFHARGAFPRATRQVVDGALGRVLRAVVVKTLVARVADEHLGIVARFPVDFDLLI